MAPRKTSPNHKSTKPKPVYDPALLAVAHAELTQDDIDDEQYRVEDLLAKRVHNGLTQYLVSWEGDWTGPFDSLTGKEKWENAADIEDSLIHQFEREAAMSARLDVEMAHTSWVRARDRSEAAERSSLPPNHKGWGKLTGLGKAVSTTFGVVKAKPKSKPVSMAKAKAKAKAKLAAVESLFDLEAEVAASDESSEEGETEAEIEDEVAVKTESESEAEVKFKAGIGADGIWRPESDPFYESMDDAEAETDDEL